MKILIISYYFPPQIGIAPLRPYSWAKHWAKAGHEVTVLTTPKNIMIDAPVPFDFRVVQVPIPGMRRLTKLLVGEVSADQDVRSRVPWSNSDVPRFNIKSRLRRIINVLQSRYGVAATCRMPDPMDVWCSAALKALDNQSWDLVVSTAGPYGVHAPAYALRRQGLAKRWIADWRDLWVDHHIYPGLPGFRLLERYLERRWCNAADAITTVSEPLADILRTKYGDKIHVIYNGFDPDDYALLPSERAFPDDGTSRIVYTGTIYHGRQDPTPLFKALAQATVKHGITPKEVQVLFCGNSANVSDLARREGVHRFVQYLGVLPRPQALHMQRDASALLLLEFEATTGKGILTGKLFEYLFAGPPIWSIGSASDSSVGDILMQTSTGVVLNRDIDSITSKIVNLLISKPIIHTEKNRMILKYSREAQARRLLEI